MDVVIRAYRPRLAIVAIVPKPKTRMSWPFFSVVSKDIDSDPGTLLAAMVLMMLPLSDSSDFAENWPKTFAKVPIVSRARTQRRHKGAKQANDGTKGGVLASETGWLP
mmetsp:Transcript_14185/g.39541  ORF Transcript_14185/g.39541 Transcript_14185/m.39541 type:complete len:108 (+) Transcript_14185:733-1056(+)